MLHFASSAVNARPLTGSDVLPGHVVPQLHRESEVVRLLRQAGGDVRDDLGEVRCELQECIEAVAHRGRACGPGVEVRVEAADRAAPEVEVTAALDVTGLPALRSVSKQQLGSGRPMRWLRWGRPRRRRRHRRRHSQQVRGRLLRRPLRLCHPGIGAGLRAVASAYSNTRFAFNPSLLVSPRRSR